jgi:hypothetical protein
VSVVIQEGQTGRTYVARYDTGGYLTDGSTQATSRRVWSGLNGFDRLTESGWQLFDNIIDWAVGAI